MHQYFKKSDNSHDTRTTNASGHQINFSELQNEQNIKNDNKSHDQEKYKNNT